ncbi:B12-binding domain-containing radical SAM protein [Geobacter sp. SVR]|uniref:B12-binding domain-containing radical SAM protein n=1 Tax=Geobacter sp. SVR TaxID=2495594 RepID=UPI00143EF776|nr:radical SAM protein [Geobacter sp. SVR]BCS53761.1 B12-binding domain-containing radical SAM protein [Geobacter sp. SVR]GCF85730.1 B12-binding domain-containing radical SAM protein [Geobacter sp. SVR]
MSMPRIVLIDVGGWQGGLGRGVHYPNIGIAYLAAALQRAGYGVTVLDLNNEYLSEEEILTSLQSGQADLVGLSVKTATMGSARRLGALIKSRYPRLPLVVGGPHASVATTEIAKEPWVDYLLVGEGELALAELGYRVAGGMLTEGVTGVVFCRTDHPLPPSVPARVPCLDDLEYPDFSVFGSGVIEAVRQSYPIITSRGCPYQCTYCSVRKISGSTVRYRSPEAVVDELDRARQEYGIRGFEVVDDSFNVDMTRSKDICRLLIERGLVMPWSCPNGIRADRIDAELATLMARSGCLAVMIGIESADHDVLAAVKKGESIEAIEKGIRVLKEAGLGVGGFFIIGLPGDSYRAQLRSVDFALKHGISAHFNMLVPYPGTEVYDWVVSHGRFLEPGSGGMHFSDSKVRPVFETDGFTARERQRAYEMAHTRLRRFDMLIPHTVPVWRRRLEVARLMLRYDAGSLLPAAVKAMVRAAIGSRNVATQRED